jgi:broad specificity phosphatase PhoE
MENIDYPAKIKNSALTFIRHGQTDSNLGGIWQGHVDNPLNETGEAEARLLNNLFRDYDLNVSSPYKRAHQTLSLIVNNDIQTSKELTEMNLGKWEGLTTTEILEKYQEQFIEALFLNHKSKYGIDGESIHEAGTRVEKLINKFENKKILMASHGGTIKSAVTKLIQSPESNAASAFTIPNNLGVSCLVPKDNKYFLWSYNVGKIGYENISYNK